MRTAEAAGYASATAGRFELVTDAMGGAVMGLRGANRASSQDQHEGREDRGERLCQRLHHAPTLRNSIFVPRCCDRRGKPMPSCVTKPVRQNPASVTPPRQQFSSGDGVLAVTDGAPRPNNTSKSPIAGAEAELKALMVAGLRGDAATYRALLVRLSRHLRAYFNRRLSRSGRPITDAEDLVQETLLAIHTNRDTFDSGEPFTPWLHAIARYKLIDYLRRTRAAQTHVPLEAGEAVVAENDAHAGAESALDLDKLLDQLPEKIQRAIRCVKIEGLSVAETAHRCGMSESAVKVNVHRGLKALARAIGNRTAP